MRPMSLPSWLRLALSEEVARRSAMIAIIVGPTLTVINQGDAWASPEGPGLCRCHTENDGKREELPIG